MCKEAKPTNQILRPPMGKERLAERPFQRIFIDFLGPYTFYIFIVLDTFKGTTQGQLWACAEVFNIQRVP